MTDRHVQYIDAHTRYVCLSEDQNWHRCSPCHTWLGHHFQGQRSRSPGFAHRRVGVSGGCSDGKPQRWASERVGRGKLLLRCRLLSHERRFGANGGRGERLVHIVAAAHLQLVYINSVRGANRLWGETKHLWGEMSFHGAKCPWGEKSWHRGRIAAKVHLAVSVDVTDIISCLMYARRYFI